MKSKLKRSIIVLLFMFLPASAIVLQSCSKEDIPEVINELLSILDQTGWLKDKENMNDIPEDITPFDDNNGGQLKNSVSLENKFPPIGNQGSYGTCVTWSVGYNLKTALNAIEKGWTSSDLANSSNQTSPKDLWLCIPSGKKGEQCEGTNFEPALDALIADGAAPLSSVPYSNMGSCTGTKTGNSNNKLANYRKIASETEGLTPENFKGYLNAGRPIAFGAKLGDRFMNWNSSAIISSDTYNNPGMQHAYHAMALVGYDDSKNAFRVRNSWGSSWGDNGSIWVDYDFFCKSFCFAAFVAQNVNSISASGGSVNTQSNGDDLLAYTAVDKTSDDEEYGRKCTYKVYNSGNTNIPASKNWSITYMYYNAKNANEYGIIFEDMYTNKYGQRGQWGNLPDEATSAIRGGFWNYVDVAAGQLVGGDDFPNGTEVYYDMPNITGEYYLVVMADAFDVIREVNEDNNFYFISASNGKPLQIVNGVIKNMAKTSGYNTKAMKVPAPYSNTETQTLVKPGNLNAYTPFEIKAMLLHDKKTGKLDAKIKSFRSKGGNPQIKKMKRN